MKAYQQSEAYKAFLKRKQLKSLLEWEGDLSSVAQKRAGSPDVPIKVILNIIKY